MNCVTKKTKALKKHTFILSADSGLYEWQNWKSLLPEEGRLFYIIQKTFCFQPIQCVPWSMNLPGRKGSCQVPLRAHAMRQTLELSSETSKYLPCTQGTIWLSLTAHTAGLGLKKALSDTLLQMIQGLLQDKMAIAQENWALHMDTHVYSFLLFLLWLADRLSFWLLNCYQRVHFFFKMLSNLMERGFFWFWIDTFPQSLDKTNAEMLKVH